MDNEDNRPHIRQGDIKYTKGYEIKLALRTLMKIIMGTIFITVVSGTIYIYINQPVLNNDGNRITAETTHRMYKEGEEVVFVDTENPNMFTPLVRFFKNNEVYNAKIIAGPYGEIIESGEEQVVKLGEVEVPVNVDNQDKKFLNEEYIIRRLNVDIEEGTDRIVTKDEILGLIKR